MKANFNLLIKPSLNKKINLMLNFIPQPEFAVRARQMRKSENIFYFSCTIRSCAFDEKSFIAKFISKIKTPSKQAPN
jgi:hypothetical protein